jgi:dTDP-4-dehydrorhamnose 3,5-epimerase
VIFKETKLKGAFILDLERRDDDRGFFARAFCHREFAEHGLNPVIAQANIAWNKRKGTLRGMHFQYPPHAETKLVRATRGSILDIIVDLRPESPTFLESVAVELSADNHRALYVPERFAHGYQALEDGTETSYQVGEFYAPGTEGGLSPFDPEVLDEYGMYMTYGEAVNAEEMSTGRYLPEGLVEGCKLKRDITKDQVLTYADVELPAGRIADALRAEQYRNFRGETWLEEHLAQGAGRSIASTAGEVRA